MSDARKPSRSTRSKSTSHLRGGEQSGNNPLQNGETQGQQAHSGKNNAENGNNAVQNGETQGQPAQSGNNNPPSGNTFQKQETQGQQAQSGKNSGEEENAQEGLVKVPLNDFRLLLSTWETNAKKLALSKELNATVDEATYEPAADGEEYAGSEQLDAQIFSKYMLMFDLVTFSWCLVHPLVSMAAIENGDCQACVLDYLTRSYYNTTVNQPIEKGVVYLKKSDVTVGNDGEKTEYEIKYRLSDKKEFVVVYIINNDSGRVQEVRFNDNQTYALSADGKWVTPQAQAAVGQPANKVFEESVKIFEAALDEFAKQLPPSATEGTQNKNTSLPSASFWKKSEGAMSNIDEGKLDLFDKMIAALVKCYALLPDGATLETSPLGKAVQRLVEFRVFYNRFSEVPQDIPSLVKEYRGFVMELQSKFCNGKLLQ